jgi:hypothetical protein
MESSSNQDGKDAGATTLGDALSLDRLRDAALVSVEELQHLAGGADIKVGCTFCSIMNHLNHCVI